MGDPFSRLDFLKNLPYFIEHGWGSYNELIELTMKDFIEIVIGIESREREAELEKSLH